VRNHFLTPSVWERFSCAEASPRVLIDVHVFWIIVLAVVYSAHFAKSNFDIDLAIPVGPFEAAGAVLGLLLVFRVNAGYSRWLKDCVLWGGIVNQSRNLAIAGLAYGPKDGRWQSNFIGCVAAFPQLIRRSLRGERSFPELQQLLPDEDLRWLSQSEHMPDAGATQVRQFVFLYLVAFPFALLANFETSDSSYLNFSGGNPYLLIPLFVMVLGYFLFSLDRIDMELQNPFDVRRMDFLPLDEMCTTIERNVLELLHETEEGSRSVPKVGEVELPPDAEPPTS
jgi:putative membrane protein